MSLLTISYMGEDGKNQNNNKKAKPKKKKKLTTSIESWINNIKGKD